VLQDKIDEAEAEVVKLRERLRKLNAGATPTAQGAPESAQAASHHGEPMIRHDWDDRPIALRPDDADLRFSSQMQGYAEGHAIQPPATTKDDA
jgi:hypothetical protein